MAKSTISRTKRTVIKSLADSGMGYREIAQTMNVSLGSISSIVREFESNRALVEWFKKNKVDILVKAQHDDLNLREIIRRSITPEQVATWTPDQKQRWYSALGIGFAVMYDKTRLESDQSTENVSVIVNMIREVKAREFERRKKDFEEWIEEHRVKKIPIPIHGYENVRSRAAEYGVDVDMDSLIFKPIEEIWASEGKS